MTSPSRVYPKKVDVTNCDKEPIHIIGNTQAHGSVIACDHKSFKITRCSENIKDFIGLTPEHVVDKPLSNFLEQDNINKINKLSAGEKIILSNSSLGGKPVLIIAHLSREEFILDIEPFTEDIDPVYFQEQLTMILNELNSSGSIEEMSDRGASLVKALFGYDRVMLYKFDEEWNGEVIAEAREENLESWLGLRYPATDIPKPSRDLFLKQGVRIISDVYHAPAPIYPHFSTLEREPLDLSRSEVRGVSPIHIQYLKNMKVGASLTAAIVLNGELWGLVACHHYSPKFINYHQRQSVKFLTQIFSNKLSLHTTNIYLQKTARSEEIRSKLVSQMASSKDIVSGLEGPGVSFTDILDSTGGALFIEGSLNLNGETPTEEEVLALIEFISDREEHIFHTKNLSEIFPEASNYKNTASGVLAVKLGGHSKDIILWFRKEFAQTVTWGGNPEKKGEVKNGVNYLSPRKSFEKYKTKVSGVSPAWEKYDFQAATALEESIIHAIVRQQKEEISALNKRLTHLNKELETFSYSVSHDLRAPLRGIEGFAGILYDDHLDKLDESGKRMVQTILSSAKEMEQLIEELLELAKLGKSPLTKKEVSIHKLSEAALQIVNPPGKYPDSVVQIVPNIPDAFGDRRLITQLLTNLLDNALKYSAKADNPLVEVGFQEMDGRIVYFVRDNGIGFDPKHRERIFKVFSRLVKEEFPGTGIGLAICKGVVERHDGKIWCESAIGEGSTFYFTLGRGKEEPEYEE